MSVLADLISERLKDKNWVVAFKTLIVSHNLMSLGHEVSSLSTTHTLVYTILYIFQFPKNMYMYASIGFSISIAVNGTGHF